MPAPKSTSARTTGPAPSLAKWQKAPVLPRPEECLALAKRALIQARQLLSEPTAEAVLRCELSMSEAAHRLRQFPKSLAKAVEAGSANGPDLRRAATAVKEELAHATLLYQRAAQFYAVWTRQFSARRCGYTRLGSPARLACTRKFDVQG